MEINSLISRNLQPFRLFAKAIQADVPSKRTAFSHVPSYEHTMLVIMCVHLAEGGLLPSALHDSRRWQSQAAKGAWTAKSPHGRLSIKCPVALSHTHKNENFIVEKVTEIFTSLLQ